MKQELEKHQQYQKLIQARNQFVIRFFSLPFLIYFCYYLLKIFIATQGLVFVLTMIFGIVAYLFVMFGFLMKDICPWCKQHFFSQSSGGPIYIKSIGLFTRKHCAHCQEPKTKSN